MLISKSRAGLGKAIETYHFRPRYALANLGHPFCSYWPCYDTDSEGTAEDAQDVVLGILTNSA